MRLALAAMRSPLGISDNSVGASLCAVAGEVDKEDPLPIHFNAKLFKALRQHRK